jgi:hypothetical protein
VRPQLEPWPFWLVSLLLMALICGTTMLMIKAPQIVYIARSMGASLQAAHQDSLVGPAKTGSFRLNNGWQQALAGPSEHPEK